MSKNIILISDEAVFVKTLRDVFEGEGYRVVTAKTLSEVLMLIEAKPADLVFLDMMHRRDTSLERALSSMEILDEIKRRKENVAVVMIGENVSTEFAAEAIKKGASDFMEKPLSLEKLLVVTARTVKGTKN